jgi:hypothetical protein
MTALKPRVVGACALMGVVVLVAGCSSSAVAGSPGTATATTSAPSLAAPTTSAPSQAAPTLSLRFPAHMAEGELNSASFTVSNPGAARTVTVQVQVDGLTGSTPNASAPNEKAIMQRHDPATGSWTDLPVTEISPASGGFGDQATYPLRLAAQHSVTERLRLVPGGVQNTTITVTLSGPSFAEVTQTATLPLVAPTLTVAGPSAVAPATTPEFDFTLTDGTAANYRNVNIGVMAYGSTPQCATTPFPAVRWSDGRGWQTQSMGNLSPSAGTISVGAGQSIEIRVKLDVPGTLPSCLTKGQVSVQVWLPGGGSAVAGPTPDGPPGFFVRGDSPFFSIS